MSADANADAWVCCCAEEERSREVKESVGTKYEMAGYVAKEGQKIPSLGFGLGKPTGSSDKNVGRGWETGRRYFYARPLRKRPTDQL